MRAFTERKQSERTAAGEGEGGRNGGKEDWGGREDSELERVREGGREGG